MPPLSRTRTGGRLAAKLEPDTRDQFAHEERLHYIVVGTDLQADDAVGLGAARSQENNRYASQVGLGTDSLTDLQAVAVGKHDIEQHQVRPRLPAKFERVLARLGVQAVEALLLQVIAQQGNQVGIIFDKENFTHICYSKNAAREVTGSLRRRER